MPTTISIYDETTLGERTNELTLEFLTETVTVREIIRSRVYQEVTEYNALLSGLFRGLIQPRQAERTKDGVKLNEKRRLDWREQYEKALTGFSSNGFLLLVGDKQMTELDQVVELRSTTPVTFLRLVPLVGG